ncbi:MAG: cupin domain-containing protein [Bryobacteraceae bacterium]
MTQPEAGSHYLDVAALAWTPTQFPGVEIKILWREPGGDAFTALFRMAPGSRLPTHRHRGVEQTWVLEGSLVDGDGACTQGNFVWRDAGSVHSAYSPNGCLSIGIFQKANEFLGEVTPPE